MEATQEEAEINEKMKAESEELQNQHQPPALDKTQADAEDKKEEEEEEKVEEDPEMTNILWNKAKKNRLIDDLKTAKKSIEEVANPLDFTGYEQSQLPIRLHQIPLDQAFVINICKDYFEKTTCQNKSCENAITFFNIENLEHGACSTSHCTEGEEYKEKDWVITECKNTINAIYKYYLYIQVLRSYFASMENSLVLDQTDFNTNLKACKTVIDNIMEAIVKLLNPGKEKLFNPIKSLKDTKGSISEDYKKLCKTLGEHITSVEVSKLAERLLSQNNWAMANLHENKLTEIIFGGYYHSSKNYSEWKLEDEKAIEHTITNIEIWGKRQFKDIQDNDKKIQDHIKKLKNIVGSLENRIEKVTTKTKVEPVINKLFMEDILGIPELEYISFLGMTQEHYDGILSTYNEVGGVELKQKPEFIEVIKSTDKFGRNFLYIGETDSDGKAAGIGMRVFDRWVEQGRFKAGRRDGHNREFWYDGGYYKGYCKNDDRQEDFIATVDGQKCKVKSTKTIPIAELFKGGVLALPPLEMLEALGQTMWNYSGINDAYKRGTGFAFDKLPARIVIREGYDQFNNFFIFIGDVGSRVSSTGIGIRVYSGWMEQGYFQGGRQHGEGKQFWGSDDYYEGEWKNGEREGQFTWTSGDGTKYEIAYESGKWQRETKIE